MLKENKKGSVLLECIVGIFMVIIMGGIVFSSILIGIKSNANRYNKRVFNENKNIIISEILYNQSFCSLVKIYDGNNTKEKSFAGDYIRIKDEYILDDFNGREVEEIGFYKVTVEENLGSVLVIKLTYKYKEENGEEIFKKYRFMENQR